MNIPVVWIDHHEIDRSKIPEFVNYYNPLLNEDKKNEPVTALCHQVTGSDEDLWIAVAGCISDKYIPEFYNKFLQNYPELGIKSKDAFEIFYHSEIGRISKIFSFALKDRTTNVINMQKFLMKAKAPHDVLEETSKNKTMHQRFEQINSRYKKILGKAIELGNNSEKVLFFQYGGDLSISSDLANELMHLFPKKLVVVVYITGVKANISARGKNIKNIILKSIKDIERATGGGHEEAVGAQVRIEDLEKFRENLMKYI